MRQRNWRQQTCDIVPDTDGWAILVNGRWLACYPSLHMAIDAAEEKSDGADEVVIRRLDVDGKYYDVETGLMV